MPQRTLGEDDNLNATDEPVSVHRPIVASGLYVFVLVLELRRLEHARDAHRRSPLFLRLELRLGLLFFQEQVRIVPRELLELHEKVAQCELEPVDVAVELLEGKDEGSDLLAMEEAMSVYGFFEEREKESRDGTHIAT